MRSPLCQRRGDDFCSMTAERDNMAAKSNTFAWAGQAGKDKVDVGVRGGA